MIPNVIGAVLMMVISGATLVGLYRWVMSGRDDAPAYPGGFDTSDLPDLSQRGGYEDPSDAHHPGSDIATGGGAGIG